MILRAARTQHLRRRGVVRLIVLARCSRTCSMTLTERVTSNARSKRGHRARGRTMLVKRVTVPRLVAGKSTKLRITLSARSRKALRNALAKRRRLTLKLSGLAKVAGMKSGNAAVAIRLVI